jgi:hypothetical protein
MATKYACPLCERKFIDWGAEKLGYKCPDCEGSDLKLIGFEPAAKAKKKKPALKRAAKKKKAVKKKAPAKKASAKTKPAKEVVLAAENVEGVAGTELEGFSVTKGDKKVKS